MESTGCNRGRYNGSARSKQRSPTTDWYMDQASPHGASRMESSGQHDYVLRGGDIGAERLKLLAQVMWPTTKKLLRQAGLREGTHCLDVGCGTGVVTLKMARWIGPTGLAVGIDMDERCVELARQQAARKDLRPVFRAGAVNDLGEESAYDLVFARFLLAHLREPGEAVQRLMRAARPGGVVVVEDIEFAANFSYPACPAFDRYVSLYQQVVRRKGADPEIGPRLLGLLQDAGLEQVELEVVQPTFCQGPGKLMAPVTMEHIREAVVDEGLATDAEVDALVSELAAFARNPRTILSMARIFQVWGRRPAS